VSAADLMDLAADLRMSARLMGEGQASPEAICDVLEGAEYTARRADQLLAVQAQNGGAQ
jgi:hypothetical protein